MSAFVLPTDGQDPVEFALGYPFARPAGSFVFEAARGEPATLAAARIVHQGEGRADGLDVPLVSLEAEVDGVPRRFDGLIPMLASGSNAAPSQLQRKYRHMPGLPPIPAVAVEARGLASVYSAHVARYGSVAATLVPCAGAVSRLHLLFVPVDGFAHLNATESVGGNYLLAALDGTPVDVAGTAVRPLAYVSRRGPARFGGAPLRLPGSAAGEGAGPAEASQEEVLERLRELMGEPGELRPFVRRLIEDGGFRAAATERLAAATRRVVPDGSRILAGG